MAMKKLTAAQAIAFLKTVGLDAELVEDAKDSDMTAKPEDATFVPTTMDDLIKLVDVNREPIISLKVKQELNESTHKDVTAKVYGGLRKQLISKGVPAADLEGKNEKEMADIAVAHFSKNKDADTEAINLQMQELIKNHESALQQTETKWKDKYTTLESTLTRKSILDNLKGIYKDAKGINPSANVDILAEDFLNDLERRANVKIGQMVRL